jgi:hypothetical protein
VARLRAGRFVEAEPELLSAFESLRTQRGASARETLVVQRHLVELYEQWDRPRLAQRYRGGGR